MCRELSRSLLFAAAIALLGQTLATADEPKLDDPSPRQILDRTAKAYVDCKSYRDSGVVTTVSVRDNGKRTVEIMPFTTAFVRPEVFRFEVEDNNRRYLISANGRNVQTWWDVRPGIQHPKSLQQAVARATGISGTVAHRIPTMLMPGKFKGWGDIPKDAKRIKDSKLENVECFRLEGKYVDNPITLWIDRKSYLVRRIDQQKKFDGFRTEVTTTYDPTVDGKITHKMLKFDPPVQEPEGSTLKNKNELKNIGYYYHFFHQANQRGPSSAAEFLSADKYEKRLHPSLRTVVESGQYVIIWDYNVKADRLRSESMFGYHTSVPESGGWVVYADGHVELITAEQFANAILANAAAE